jgi:hypothetical protein
MNRAIGLTPDQVQVHTETETVVGRKQVYAHAADTKMVYFISWKHFHSCNRPCVASIHVVAAGWQQPCTPGQYSVPPSGTALAPAHPAAIIQVASILAAARCQTCLAPSSPSLASQVAGAGESHPGAGESGEPLMPHASGCSYFTPARYSVSRVYVRPHQVQSVRVQGLGAWLLSTTACRLERNQGQVMSTSNT